jgi:hypothetical protein
LIRERRIVAIVEDERFAFGAVQHTADLLGNDLDNAHDTLLSA